MTNKQTAYVLARIGLGLDLTMHGLVRIPDVQDFVVNTEKQFHATKIPAGVTATFLMILPFIELLVGVCVLAGIFTKRTLVIGTLLMFMLLFGSTLLQNWDNVAIQLGYIAYYAGLIYFVDLNRLAVDNLFKSTSRFKNP